MSKVIPSYMSFEQALMSGYVGRIEDRAYMNWVKTLSCCGCRAPADDPHHLYGGGFKGMGTKVPDYMTIPLCRVCHDELHRDVDAWEQRNGEQMRHIVMTLTQAIHEGRLKFHE